MNINNLRDFEEKAINFINTINKNYIINDDGFLYFPDKHIAISLNEKYESSNLYKPKDYFTNITNTYRDKGIRLMNLFDWRIDHEDSWNKIKMLLITAIGNPKKIMSRKCEVRQITNNEANYILTYEVDSLNVKKAYIMYTDSYDQTYKVKLNLKSA